MLAWFSGKAPARGVFHSVEIISESLKPHPLIPRIKPGGGMVTLTINPPNFQGYLPTAIFVMKNCDGIGNRDMRWIADIAVRTSRAIGAPVKLLFGLAEQDQNSRSPRGMVEVQPRQSRRAVIRELKAFLAADM